MGKLIFLSVPGKIWKSKELESFYCAFLMFASILLISEALIAQTKIKIVQPTKPLQVISLPAPNQLRAELTSENSVQLIWNDPSEGKTGIKIERKSGKGGIYAEIASLEPGKHRFLDSKTTPGETFYYHVRAFVDSDKRINFYGIRFSSYSNEVTVKTREILQQFFPVQITVGKLTVTGKILTPTPPPPFSLVEVTTGKLTVTGKILTPIPPPQFSPVDITTGMLTVSGKAK